MLDNLTPFAAEIIPGYDIHGAAQNIVVVKGTFDLQGRVALYGRQLPVLRGDLYFEAPELSQDMRFESDQVSVKPRVDVIVNGFAYAPGARPATQFDAGIAVDREIRAVRVFGPRMWRNRLGVFPSITAPQPTLRVPLVYSLAFGGTDPGDPLRFAQANPTGRGFCVGTPMDGLELPQVEWQGELIASPNDQPTPAGFGCYGRTWLPRRKLLGQYTPHELDRPGLVHDMPESFDAAAWNCAHPRMQFSFDQVRPGTLIQLRNLSANGLLQIKLPDARVRIAWDCGQISGSITPPFDTVTIEPELEHFALTWRCVLPTGSQALSDDVRIHLQCPLN